MSYFAYNLNSRRFNLKDVNFRYRPPPQPDELLSSWLVRTSLLYHTDPATFVNLYLPQWKNNLWTRDVDVWADKPFLGTLSEKSSLTFDTLFNLTLRSYEGYLAENITSKTRNPFIQSLGRKCRITVSHGLRFCPICLKEDRAPYFRKKWRLSFSTACLMHKCFLEDRCEVCKASVNPNRSIRENDLGITSCYNCGSDLRQIRPKQIHEGSYGLWAISKLYEILESGVFRFHGGYTYSFLFFIILRHFVRIVYYMGRNRGLLEHETMANIIEFRRKPLEINLMENIPLKEQYLLFSGLMRLFEGFPGRVFSFCGANRLRGSDLKGEIERIPFWYHYLVNAFNMEAYSVSTDEVKSAIKCLEAKKIPANKINVTKILGICADLKKRQDIQRLLKDGCL